MHKHSPKRSGLSNNLLGIVVAFVAALSSGEAQAIPAFARTYEVPCSTCHTAFGRRNEFGDAFRRAGMHWPGDPDADARARKDEPIELRGLAAVSSWLPKYLPLSFQVAAAGAISSDPAVRATIAVPSFRLLVGSSLGKYASVWASWYGLGLPFEAILQINRPWGRPELNLRIGKLEQSTSLYKTNEALLWSHSGGTTGYPASHNLISQSTISGWQLGAARPGIEAHGVFLSRGFYAAGVVRNGDFGFKVDPYYQIGLKLGGMDLLGQEPNVDLDKPSLLDDFSLTLAHWGYIGQQPDESGFTNADIRRFGVEMKLTFRNALLWSGFMYGADRFRGATTDNRSQTLFAEISYPILPWLTPMYGYQYQYATSFSTRVIHQHDWGVVFIFFENVRARLRYQYSPTLRTSVGDLQLVVVI